jgi:hypothetical protein
MRRQFLWSRVGRADAHPYVTRRIAGLATACQEAYGCVTSSSKILSYFSAQASSE